MIKIITFLILLLSSLVAKMEVVTDIAKEKEAEKKKIESLYKDINHPQLFNFYKKKIDD